MLIGKIVFFIIICLSALDSCYKHGKQREPYSWYSGVLGSIISFLILWWGGFWKGFLFK